MEVTPGRSAYYEAETPPAADKFEKNAIAAKGTYKSAMADPKIADRFAGGLKGKASKFARKVTSVGIARFGPGVEAAETDMADGFSPYQAILDGLTISDRKPRGDPSNYGIVKEVGDPLHKKRLALLGATATASS
ncbi:MAG: hypothetical protein ACE5OO_02430 [Candidatus Bathyarchaeia archaeon]